jgi:peroxiredoxin
MSAGRRLALLLIVLWVAAAPPMPAAAESTQLPTLLPAAPVAPSFKVRTLTGEKIELAELVRHGPVVLDFWATWCKPCLYALPELQRAHERYAAQGVTVVGISEDGPRNYAKVRPFASRYLLTYPLVLDEDGSLQGRYQVRSLPTTFVIDRAGRIAWTHQGYQPGLAEMIDEALARALADTAAGTPE